MQFYKKRKAIKIIATIWFIIGIVFISWLFYTFQAHNVDEHIFQSNDNIKIETASDFYLFTPNNGYRNTLMFYPGAMVSPEAYAPLCRRIAENNIQVYLIKMPWRLASKGYNIPIELGLLNDSSKTYILAGHSLGAKMAAQFVYENPSLIDKLILIGTSHPRDISLEDTTIPILKIYGTKDGIASKKAILKNRSKLPKATLFAEIEGANHSQFGYYGFQLGDKSATISREQQQAEALKCILEFINK